MALHMTRMSSDRSWMLMTQMMHWQCESTCLLGSFQSFGCISQTRRPAVIQTQISFGRLSDWKPSENIGAFNQPVRPGVWSTENVPIISKVLSGGFDSRKEGQLNRSLRKLSVCVIVLSKNWKNGENNVMCLKYHVWTVATAEIHSCN